MIGISANFYGAVKAGINRSKDMKYEYRSADEARAAFRHAMHARSTPTRALFDSYGVAAQIHSMLTGYLTDETAEPADVANVARMAVLLELLFGEEVLHQARYSPMYIAEILAVEILPRCAGRGGAGVQCAPAECGRRRCSTRATGTSAAPSTAPRGRRGTGSSG